MSIAERLLADVDRALAAGTGDDRLLQVLDLALQHFRCATGTIHALDPSARLLHLRAQRGIPAQILDRVRAIPVGKGMAGLAAERLEPVQVCNLQTDSSGVAKPGAKLTEMAGSIAAPMIAGGVLKGTFGVAKPSEYEFTPEERQLLLDVGARVGRVV